MMTIRLHLIGLEENGLHSHNPSQITAMSTSIILEFVRVDELSVAMTEKLSTVRAMS
jgi:hypothetical protein